MACSWQVPRRSRGVPALRASTQGWPAYPHRFAARIGVGFRCVGAPRQCGRDVRAPFVCQLDSAGLSGIHSGMTAKPRILLIDDDASHAEIAGESLERADFAVTLAHSGDEGLRKFREGEFDVVLTDLRLPDTDGMEVLKRIKAADADVEVIIITGYGSVEKAVEALQQGAY